MAGKASEDVTWRVCRIVQEGGVDTRAVIRDPQHATSLAVLPILASGAR